MGEEAAVRDPLVVQKFGGSSLATAEAIRGVARRVVETRRSGHRVVAVVSARGDHTDELVEAARQVSSVPVEREIDALLSTGEQVSTALLAMAIAELGEEAVSLTGAQCGILTNDVHTNARILEVHAGRLRRELARGAIVVAAGFQGVTADGDVTTIGRGGSDTTAVALAAALGADRCEVYTDVDGIYTADPRVIPSARRISELDHRIAQELTWHGARVLKAEAVELAGTNGVTVSVHCTFGGADGTRVTPDTGDVPFQPRLPAIAGVSGRGDLLRISVAGPGWRDSASAELFAAIAPYDLVFGGVTGDGRPTALLLSTEEMADPSRFASELRRCFGAGIDVREGLGAVSLVGFGLGSRAQSLLVACQVLRDAGVPVLETFSSRDSYSFVVACEDVASGVRVLHDSFVEIVPAAVPAARASGAK